MFAGLPQFLESNVSQIARQLWFEGHYI